MHALLLPFGSHGDVHPFVGLALALRERGHRVTFATSGYFHDLMERAGLEYVDLLSREEFLRVAGHPDVWHPLRAARHLFVNGLAPVLRETHRLIVDAYVPGETVVVSNCLGLGPRFARESHGVPLVTVHLQPAVIWSDHDSPRLPNTSVGPWVPRWFKRFQFWVGERLILDRVIEEAGGAFRRELGLPRVTRSVRWWQSPDANVCLFPEWYAPRQPDWPANLAYAGFPLWDESTVAEPQPELERFLAEGDPPIVFTPGSANMLAGKFFAAAVDACRRLNRRGLFLSKFAEQIPGGLPETIRHFEYVPFSAVFPRAAAVVHHGGIGTCAQALRAGVPQLVMPLSHDQPDNADRLRKLGVGDALKPSAFTGRHVERRLRRLLESNGVRHACREVALRFDESDPFAIACDVVERTAKRQTGTAVVEAAR